MSQVKASPCGDPNHGDCDVMISIITFSNTRRLCDALSLLEQARQHLLLIGNEEIYAHASTIESVCRGITETFTQATGIPNC